VTRILETAEEKNCDLIVMGTHGRGALMDAMMGSTTNRVTRRSKIPVLSVRLPEKA
jgi:nucleotide-binding universal stress UspA family protein